jgi:uncharacterized damage-inducible protein DinB
VLDEIRQLYAYNSWANHRFLGAVEVLQQDEFARDLGSSFPSVGATLAHILGAEWIWLQRWRGVSPSDFPSEWNTTTPAALAAQWREFELEQRAFLAAVTGEALGAAIEYRNTSGARFSNPLCQLMRHVVNHSTYHRGQVATMLRQLGHTVRATDLIAWYRERAAHTGD